MENKNKNDDEAHSACINPFKTRDCYLNVQMIDNLA